MDGCDGQATTLLKRLRDLQIVPFATKNSTRFKLLEMYHEGEKLLRNYDSQVREYISKSQDHDPTGKAAKHFIGPELRVWHDRTLATLKNDEHWKHFANIGEYGLDGRDKAETLLKHLRDVIDSLK